MKGEIRLLGHVPADRALQAREVFVEFDDAAAAEGVAAVEVEWDSDLFVEEFVAV